MSNQSVRSRTRSTSWWPVVGIAALTLWTFVRPPAGQGAAPREAGQGSAADASRPVEAPAAAAAEPGHGRRASSPTEIPARGWKDVGMRVFGDLSSHRILAVAAGVTFYALLAIFPAIAALVSLYGLFADPATIGKQLAAVSGFLPGGATDILGEQVKRIAAKGGGSLSFGFVSGLAVALWSANAGMKAMFDALNVVYDEAEKRSFVRLNAASLTFTLGAIGVLLLAVASVVVLPVVLNLVSFGPLVEQGLALLRWPVLLVLVVLGFALLYRFGPSRARARWRWITPGSAFAAVAWLVGSALFSWYVSSFGSYNATYGSLGAAIGFMTWIWISTIIVLIGGELNAEMELQTVADTTAGSPKPLGTRGAAAADQVGKAA